LLSSILPEQLEVSTPKPQISITAVMRHGKVQRNTGQWPILPLPFRIAPRGTEHIIL